MGVLAGLRAEDTLSKTVSLVQVIEGSRKGAM